MLWFFKPMLCIFGSNKCQMFLIRQHWSYHTGNTKIYFGNLGDPCFQNVWASRFNIPERHFWLLDFRRKTTRARAYAISTCSASMDLYILIYPFVFLLIFCWTVLFLFLLYLNYNNYAACLTILISKYNFFIVIFPKTQHQTYYTSYFGNKTNHLFLSYW